MLLRLHAPVDDDEIKSTILSMKSLKAPGLDGLHAVFYQSQWLAVGPLCVVLLRIFFPVSIPLERLIGPYCYLFQTLIIPLI